MTSGHVFHRRLARILPKAVRAEGVWVEDAEGKRYLDASAGPLCVNVGHGRREVIRAMAEQAESVDYVHGNMFTTESLENLAERLANHAPEGIDRFYFISSGSEAIETAVKLARQIQLARGETGRYKIISRKASYHGATLGALSLGGRTSMRQPFTPMLLPSIHINPPYCLRCPYGLVHPSCGLRCAHVLDDVIRKEGAHSISGFLAETICGATLTAVVPPPDYYTVIRDICHHHGVLLILDEVMCGLGRTGRWFASEHYGVEPDLVTLGKGLGSGYVAISAVGCGNEHMELIKEHSGWFVHGHTYSHHAIAASAALAVLKIIENENLVDRVRLLGRTFRHLLEPLRDHPHVGDVRGIGLMWGVELVKDKKNLSPYPRAEKIAERMHQDLMDRGIITYECSGFVGGDGDALLLGPPFIIEEEHLSMAVRELTAALDGL